MNEEQCKLLIISMTKEIKNSISQFFSKNLTEDFYDTSDIINLVLSAHLSSLISITEQVSKDLDDGGQRMIKFNEGLMKYIMSSHPIVKIEMLTSK